MLFGFDGHAFPLDDDTAEYLRDQKVLEEGASLDESQRFIEHQLKAEECYDLFAALRRVVSDEGTRAKKKK